MELAVLMIALPVHMLSQIAVGIELLLALSAREFWLLSGTIIIIGWGGLENAAAGRFIRPDYWRKRAVGVGVGVVYVTTRSGGLPGYAEEEPYSGIVAAIGRLVVKTHDRLME
jgi:hypothetical protein